MPIPLTDPLPEEPDNVHPVSLSVVRSPASQSRPEDVRFVSALIQDRDRVNVLWGGGASDGVISNCGLDVIEMN